MFGHYLSWPEDTILDIKYCKYYEKHMVSNTLAQPQQHGETRYWTIRCTCTRDQEERTSAGLTCFVWAAVKCSTLKFLLLHTTPFHTFLLARTVDGTVHESFQAAARALGLLDNTKGEPCFTEAMESGYSPEMPASDTSIGWSTSTGSPEKSWWLMWVNFWAPRSTLFGTGVSRIDWRP